MATRAATPRAPTDPTRLPTPTHPPALPTNTFPQGGKSVFTRQVALTVILAQCGSFVPALRARLTVCDGVFTRMGASDSLALGTSTFLEEMSETSNILKHATERSLVVLDELGRGTSTRDGQAIAEATVSFLARETKALTLFVTHYPSVARGLAADLPGSVACSYASFVEEKPEEKPEVKPMISQSSSGQSVPPVQNPQNPPRISFLYKQTPGISPSSFGLNVALMAGVPGNVVAAAGAKAAEVEHCATTAAAGGGGDEAEAALLRSALGAVEALLGASSAEAEDEGAWAEAVGRAQGRAAAALAAAGAATAE